jgi:hypothetical protein
MPSMIGRTEKALFGYVKDKVWKKIQSWLGRHLPKAGRDVLVKLVTHAILDYCTSTVFLLEYKAMR